MRDETREVSATGDVRWRAPYPSHRIPKSELMWLAGLWEGEGSFYLNDVRDYPKVIAQIAMSDLDVIQRAYSVLGVGTVNEKKPGPRSNKMQWSLRVSAQAEVRWVMDQLYPHMGQRRRSKIDDLRSSLPEWSKP